MSTEERVAAEPSAVSEEDLLQTQRGRSLRRTRVGTVPTLLISVVTALLVQSMFIKPEPTQAYPTFTVAYGLKCEACHTVVPALNAYGRYIQRTGYAVLDRKVLARTLPVWMGENLNYNSTAGSGTGTPRSSFGNLSLVGAGYVAPDVTFRVQQWVTASDQQGFVDTMWVTYNNLFHHDGHLFIGKIFNPAPSMYSQTADLDGPRASLTVVGEHDWSTAYNNRWGTRLAYVHGALDAEAGYYISNRGLDGATYYGAGDKTFQWKVAYAPPARPFEAGVFGNVGSIPVSTNSGIDPYQSTAGYVQLDPGSHGRPGLLAIYQGQFDKNPGMSGTGFVLGPTTSRGASVELYEPLVRGAMLLSLRHDFNDSGAGGPIGNGNAVNLAFSVPGLQYLNGYVETLVGGNSALAGASGGPTWKGKLWLTLPIQQRK